MRVAQFPVLPLDITSVAWTAQPEPNSRRRQHDIGWAIDFPRGAGQGAP